LHVQLMILLSVTQMSSYIDEFSRYSRCHRWWPRSWLLVIGVVVMHWLLVTYVLDCR